MSKYIPVALTSAAVVLVVGALLVNPFLAHQKVFQSGLERSCIQALLYPNDDQPVRIIAGFVQEPPESPGQWFGKGWYRKSVTTPVPLHVPGHSTPILLSGRPHAVEAGSALVVCGVPSAGIVQWHPLVGRQSWFLLGERKLFGDPIEQRHVFDWRMDMNKVDPFTSDS